MQYKCYILPISAHSYNRSVSCSSAAFDCAIPTSSKHFDFEVSDFFIFGSPLAVVLAYRKACFFNHANITGQLCMHSRKVFG